MREETLPSPHIGGKGHHLRRIAAQAISQLEIAAATYNGRHPQATALKAFFDACSTACAAILPIAATPVFTPTAKSYSIAAGPAAGPALSGVGGNAVTYTSATPAKATVDPTTGVVTPVATGTSVITATWVDGGGVLAGTATYTATVTA